MTCRMNDNNPFVALENIVRHCCGEEKKMNWLVVNYFCSAMIS